MDSNDARRSKVPAGTFRSSNRPPAPAGDDAVAKPAATPPPPPPAASVRPKSGIPAGATPTRRVGTNSAAPPKLEPPTDVDGKAKFTSTLVGVTPSKAPPPPAAGAAPVLAPPPWRGASAYQGGQEPQPRVSSISSPGITPSVLADGTVAHPDDRRVPHTRITAAAPPAPPQGAEKATQATAEIGDAIQQLLDSQTSVSMEGVQESAPVPTGTLRGQPTDELLRDSALEPVRESQIEVLRDSAIEEVEPVPPVRSLPPAAPITKRSAIDETQRTLVEPSAIPEPRPAPPSARWSAPTPVVREPAPAPAPVMSDRELAAYSFVEREERDSSFAPAELGQKLAPEADEPNVRMGIWVAAAIALVGIGGWLVTRGGFDIPPRTKTAATVIAAPPAAPVVDAPTAAPASPELGDVDPAPAATPTQPAVTAAAPVAPAPPAAAEAKPPAPAPAPSRAPVAARAPRAIKPEPAPTPAPAAAPALEEREPQPGDSLTVMPTAPAAAVPTPAPSELAGPMPETPTRENVQSALDAKRAEVLQCAAGAHGVAEVDLTVSSTGAVTHAVVAGDFAGTAAGSCIARVVRTARFAPFSKPRFRVIYPFSL